MSKNLTQRQITKRLVISAVFIAISIVLNNFLAIQWPMGGSITVFSLVPLALLGWQYGVSWGLVSGLTMGVLNMLIGGLGNFAYVSGITAYLILMLMDYFVAFAVFGLAGIFKNKIHSETAAFGIGAGLACVLRFLCHFISGVTIWGDYANGWANAWIYSLTYNGGYMLPELVITVIGCCIVINVKPIMKSLAD